MSEQKIPSNDSAANGASPEGALDELQPLREIWNQYGRSAVVAVLIAVAVTWGVSAWRSHREQIAADESAALFQANRADDLRNLAATARNPAIAADAWSRAGAAYQDEAVAPGTSEEDRRACYEKALEAYRTLEEQFADSDLAQTAALGIATCQEALGDPAAAATTLDAWLEAHPGHFAAQFAVLDAIRAHRLAGDLATARVRGEDYKVAHPDDALTAVRIDDALALVAQAERAAARPVPAEEESPAEAPVSEESAAEEAAPAESAE